MKKKHAKFYEVTAHLRKLCMDEAIRIAKMENPLIKMLHLDVDFTQLSEAIFCEAAFRHFGNLDRAHGKAPYPRGQLFLNRLEGLLAAMNEQASKPLVEVVSR